MPIDPGDARMQIQMGEVRSGDSRIKVWIDLEGNGRGHVVVYADEPDDRRKSGTLLFLNLENYNALRRVFRKTDETIKELSQSKKLNDLKLPWE